LYMNVYNPFDFMDKINAKIQVDFFVHENADYSIAKNNADDGEYGSFSLQ
jgi:ribonucleotide reductase beta subunit family protein with ferritin-like domain